MKQEVSPLRDLTLVRNDRRDVYDKMKWEFADTNAYALEKRALKLLARFWDMMKLAAFSFAAGFGLGYVIGVGQLHRGGF